MTAKELREITNKTIEEGKAKRRKDLLTYLDTIVYPHLESRAKNGESNGSFRMVQTLVYEEIAEELRNQGYTVELIEEGYKVSW